MTAERAVLAGGCIWGMQDLIRGYPGVISPASVRGCKQLYAKPHDFARFDEFGLVEGTPEAAAEKFRRSG